MKRALLVSAGTAVGLVSVLSYSGQAVPTLAGVPTGVDGLGAPAKATPIGASERAAAASSPAPRATAKRHRAKATPSGTPARKARTRTPSSTATPTTSRRPSKSTPKSTLSTPVTKAPATKAPSAKPKPTPTKAGPVDYLGPAAMSKYGPLQVSIRVSNGKVIDVWAPTFPTGTSQPYSEMAIPILKAQTLAAQSAHIAGASGASFTSSAWMTSLAGALAKAHL